VASVKAPFQSRRSKRSLARRVSSRKRSRYWSNPRSMAVAAQAAGPPGAKGSDELETVAAPPLVEDRTGRAHLGQALAGANHVGAQLLRSQETAVPGTSDQRLGREHGARVVEKECDQLGLADRQLGRARAVAKLARPAIHGEPGQPPVQLLPQLAPVEKACQPGLDLHGLLAQRRL